MKQRDIYDVIAIGLSRQEVNNLGAIFLNFGQNSDTEFRLVEGELAEQSHFAVVNADNPQILRKWRVWNARVNPIFSIYAHSDIAPKNAPASIKKPFTPNRVIDGMQQALYRAFEKLPSFEISDTTESSDVKKLNSIGAKKVHSKVSALVVDDCPTILKSMELQLDLLGIHPDCCATGEQAMERINKLRYDLIFLDIVLPGIDGYEICKMIRQSPIQKNTPVCMLTGKSNMFNMVKGKLAGCDKYITKPASSNELADAILKMLNISSFKQLKTA
ncbi:response regulator [Aliikangiella coralliicola]|uniref:Response regulator n=1 Tax=Aliikangiella coralliicola TaxID=2592383 RepID=A0A545UHY2_9GAMM|nr:response regulator [Aliikangiella coralliicola]TQV89075.1 response regulator [Aliikangiella coralliicola]